MASSTTFVLLDGPIKLDSSVLFKLLKARHPDQAIAIPPDDGCNPNATLISVSGTVVAVMQFAAALLDGWQSAASGAALYWPEAEAVFRRHRAHLVVAALGNSDRLLETARVTAAVVGAIVAAYPACTGVLWDLAVANSSQVVGELSTSAFAPYPNLPSSLWVSMHPFRDPGTPRAGVVTTGLRKFIGREIELEGQVSQLKTLLTTAAGLITYLVQNGADIRDGDTIGGSASERIPVRLTESRRFKDLPVIAASLPVA
jgi:hypothetical protein